MSGWRNGRREGVSLGGRSANCGRKPSSLLAPPRWSLTGRGRELAKVEVAPFPLSPLPTLAVGRKGEKIDNALQACRQPLLGGRRRRANVIPTRTITSPPARVIVMTPPHSHPSFFWDFRMGRKGGRRMINAMGALLFFLPPFFRQQSPFGVTRGPLRGEEEEKERAEEEKREEEEEDGEREGMRGGIVCHTSREEDIPFLLPSPLFSMMCFFSFAKRRSWERKRGQVMGHGGRKEKDPSLVFGRSSPSVFNRSLPPSISPLFGFF